MKDDPGFIYGLVNDRFPGFIKIGKAQKPKSRLGNYNVGDPHRSYKFAFVLSVPDYSRAELQAQQKLDGYRVPNTEWFKLAPADARALLLFLTEETP